jgi:hypothetical protein
VPDVGEAGPEPVDRRRVRSLRTRRRDEHFSADVINNVVQKTEKPVEPMARGDELIAGSPRKNFRGFINNLKNYCPRDFSSTRRSLAATS